MKTIIAAMLLILAVLMMGLVGCESAEDHQHHLYNLQKCRTETDATTTKEADSFSGTTYVDGRLVRTFKTASEQQAFEIATSQSHHDSLVAKCMAEEERTTLEYQKTKHDDYGKTAAKP
jgi:hypothetical protein